MLNETPENIHNEIFQIFENQEIISNLFFPTIHTASHCVEGNEFQTDKTDSLSVNVR